jgi:hypothetical protein
MIVEVTEMYNKWNKGNSFVLNNIPNVRTVEDVKNYLWNDVTINHLFNSREELDTDKWQIEIAKVI